MSKKILALLLVFILVFSLAACSKKDPVENTTEMETVEGDNSTTNETSSEEESNEVETPVEEEGTSETGNLVGAWTIVNQNFDEAPQDVKDVYENAMKSVDGQYIPVTYIGSQVVSGMNYGFIAKDSQTLDRYVYIYKNAQGEIETIKISDPGERLEMVPTKEEIEAGVVEEEKVEETAQEEKPENTNADKEPTNVEEGLAKSHGSLQAAKEYYATSDMSVNIAGNEIVYTYTYPKEIEFTDTLIPIYKEEILKVYEENASAYVKTVESIEKDSGIKGLTYVVKYVTSDNKEVVTVKFNNQGMIKE